MRTRTMLGALTLAAVACQYGTRPKNFQPAQYPSGAIVAVRVGGDTADRVGELYAVDSVGVTVRAGRLTRVAWARLYAMDVDKVGRSVDVRPLEVVSPEKRRRLAALSRFPQGLPDDLLKQVLIKLGQDSLDQIARADLDSLARVATSASVKYRDRRAAITDGYRRIGGDFPGMGEHWVHPLRIQSRERIDANRPSFLTYAAITGEPKLLGIGFIVTSDSASTGAPPGWPEQWHEHSGLLGDESGGRMANPAQRADETRVFVLHVWTTLENPEGRYAPDNWALPFARIGLPAPRGIDADAGRAFSLAVGGDEFFVGTLSDFGLRPRKSAAATDSVVASARGRALKVAERARARNTPDEDLTELRAIWADLATSLQAVIGPSVVQVMRPAHPIARHTSSTHANAPPR